MEITVFTDGSAIKDNKCKNNRHKFIGGYGVHFPNGEIVSYGKKLKKLPATNQRAELYAVFSALKKINKYINNNNINIKNINIYSDSLYCVKIYTVWFRNWERNNWVASNNKPVLNQDIIKDTLILIKQLKKDKKHIKFNHINSHTGNTDFNSIANDVADKYAKDGCAL